MINKLFSNRKFNILVKTTALAMCVSLVCLEMASITAKATSVPEAYKPAHGEHNKSNDLYIWRKWSGYRKDSLTDLLSNKSQSEPFRLLLTYTTKNNGSYYIEADWTKLRFTNSGGDVAGSALQAVSTNDNTQVLAGNDSFITRGALRSFVAYNKGLEGALFKSGYNDCYRYQLCAPNAEDNGPEKINGGNVTLCYTYDGKNNGMYFYDKDGNPCGNKDYDSHWNHKNQNKSSQTVTIDMWYMASDWGNCLVARDDWGNANPMLVLTDNSTRYSKMGAFNLTVDEIATATSSVQEFDVYVGEKIGTTDNIGEGNTTCKISKGLAINKPAYLRSDQTLIIEEGAVLFVNSIFEVNGTIENHGTIVVGNDCAIIGDADAKTPGSYLFNDGGDIVLRPRGYLMIGGMKACQGSVLVIHTKNPKDNLMVAKGMDITDCIFDYDAGGNGNGNRSAGSDCSGIAAYGYSGVSIDNNNKEKLLKFTHSQASFVKDTGSSTFYDRNVLYDD